MRKWLLRQSRLSRKGNVWVSIEIMAEVVYVLKGVYGVKRQKIGEKLLDFLNEVSTAEPEVLKLGIKMYAEYNLDFPDCVFLTPAGTFDDRAVSRRNE